MENITGETNIIKAEIEETEKAILKERESHKELDREVKNHFKEYNDLPSGADKEIKTYLTNAMREGLRGLQTHRHAIEGLQSRLDTLKQSKTAKVNKIMHKDTPEKQEQANGQGTTQDTARVQGLKVSFNKTDYIVTINGKEYLFEKEDKKSKKRRKLFNEYKLFELLHRNRDRYVNMDEIKGELGIRKGRDTDQKVYNIKSEVREIIKESPYEIKCLNNYEDRGGYKLTLKQQD